MNPASVPRSSRVSRIGPLPGPQISSLVATANHAFRQSLQASREIPNNPVDCLSRNVESTAPSSWIPRVQLSTPYSRDLRYEISYRCCGLENNCSFCLKHGFCDLRDNDDHRRHSQSWG